MIERQIATDIYQQAVLTELRSIKGGIQELVDLVRDPDPLEEQLLKMTRQVAHIHSYMMALQETRRHDSQPDGFFTKITAAFRRLIN